MFIKVTNKNNSKPSNVYLVEGYRDESGKSKQRTIKKYGKLSKLQENDPNILKKLEIEAKAMEKNEIFITHSLLKSNSNKEKDKNYGYFFLDNIYKSLGITEFIKDYKFKINFKYDIDEILRLLTFGRILNPMSKKATVEHQEEYFEPFNVSLKSTYKSLSNLAEIKIDLQNHLNKTVTSTYGRDASLVFYDVTNYYFETEIENNLKEKGMSKENKRTPIVQMGLLIDNKGLPIAYDLFPGNNPDITTLIPFIKNMRKQYNFGRVILTADKGLNSGKNLAYLKSQKDGYIVSQKIRGGSKKFIKKVLSEEGYSYNNAKTFKIKSFIRERATKDEDGKKVILKEKVVCFWSKNFDDREKHERDVNLDGYYTIITSELDLTDEKIIEKYRGLWKIEESFRVLKSDLEGRPVYVTNEAHVEEHFLVCFIALLISRILEMKLDNKYSVKKIQEALKNATCRKIYNGLYSLNKQDELFRKLDTIFNLNFDYSEVRIEKLRQWKKHLDTT